MVVARPVKFRQVVQVQILNARRPYTYGWWCEPGVIDALAVGDRVELPPNQVQEEGTAGTVTRLGSDYNGEMKFIVRKIEDNTTEVDDRWPGWGQGDYA